MANRDRSRSAVAQPCLAGIPLLLLTCRGPRCSAAGAADLHARLQEKLAQSHALDTEVLVTVTGCMYPCNHAPLIVVWPDGKCIQLTEDNLDRIVSELTGPSRQ